MNMTQHATTVLEFDQMLPAVAQGAIGIQCREGDEKILRYLNALNHEPTKVCDGRFVDAPRCSSADANDPALPRCAGVRRLRARLPRGSRRQLPHADRRAGETRRRAGARITQPARRPPLTPPSTWQILFSGLIAKPDGSVIFETSRTGDLADAAKLGDAAGQELKEKCGNDFEAFFGGDDIAPEPVSSTSGKKTDGLGGYVDS